MEPLLAIQTATDFFRVILLCSFIGILACLFMRKIVTGSQLHPITTNVSMIAFLVAIFGATLSYILVIDELDAGISSGGFLTGLAVLSSVLGFLVGVISLACQFFRK
jgi:hypothetical protein